MLDLIRDMLTSPGSPADAYGWGAALLAHAFIGVILTALIGWIAGAWRGAAIASGGYLLIWEGAQIAIFGGGVPDGLVDAAAVACGAVVAAGAWRNRGAAVGAALALLAVIGIAGVRRRR
ncbi:hypothetical protein [Paracoccus hibiscisoli]|uniref:Uncharacterized protein n=1 Tax=Paracoccus hibiscisoli TaxID=2023261 RepID=A0A4U0QVG2_9RHOB|nr:hypothetical protein [Paracoccus hibiscisoli]TJZ86171.1 hypothetical protein FA740_04590 [Paracoccus hibiscisoli]